MVLRSSFSVGGRGVDGAARNDVLDECLKARSLLLQVVDLGGVSDDHHRAVVDVGVVRGAGDHESVHEGDGHADLHQVARAPRKSRLAAEPCRYTSPRPVRRPAESRRGSPCRSGGRHGRRCLRPRYRRWWGGHRPPDGRSGAGCVRSETGFAHGEHFLSRCGGTRTEGVLGADPIMTPRRRCQETVFTTSKHESESGRPAPAITELLTAGQHFATVRKPSAVSHQATSLT